MKLAGPIIHHIRAEMCSWTTSGPPDGEEPRWVNGSIFEVSEPRFVRRMESLSVQLEENAHEPPIVFYDRFVDPWTFGPALEIYTRLRGQNAGIRLARSRNSVEYLLIQPQNWGRFTEYLLQLHEEIQRQGVHPESINLIDRLRMCALAWDKLLSRTQICRAVLIICRSIDISWIDEDVLNGCNVPKWYDCVIQ